MDGYSRVKLLGEGSFGRVFLMREKKPDGRLVCVKQIQRVHHPSKIGSVNRPKSNATEVDLMKKLRHPNLIRLLNSFVGPYPLRQQFIVMEYCSEGDLQTYLKTRYRASRKQLSEAKIWYWFVQLALGLHHMHQHRVLHRDLKTANIFLSNDGYLVLGDLGIARTLPNSDMVSTVIGTPLYMAPEVLEGKNYSFSSDVWALGCVLYELCTGKPPFTANNSVQLLSKICRGEYVPIQKRGNLTSLQLPTLVASMLETRSDLRPSVDQLLRDSSARDHIRGYCVDRLSSSSMTEEERRVLVQQVRALSIDAKITSDVVDGEGNIAESVNPSLHMGVESYSRHKCNGDQSRANQANQEGEQMDARECERQDQICFALEKLQQLRLQRCQDKTNAEVTDSNNSVKPPPPPLKLNLVRYPLHDEQWREPVRATSETPRRRPTNLSHSNSVPKELVFTGVPRIGVPLAGISKTFATRHPVCHDVRVLKKQEAVKTAERYKRRLDIMNTRQQQGITSTTSRLAKCSHFDCESEGH